MKIKIITVGEPKGDYKNLFLEYLKRLKKFIKVEHLVVKDNKKKVEKILKIIDKSFLVLLDEKGKEFSSQELANFLAKKEQSLNEIIFLIGGPDGHPEEVYSKANFLWSFSKLTFPHDLAMVVLVEALYRSYSILNHHPYHRE